MNTLTIRISQEHIIFCTYNRLLNHMPNFEVYNNNPDISLNANIHKAIKSYPLAQSHYNIVEVYCVEPTTLVPLKEFEEEDAGDIYFFNYPALKHSNKVFYDALPYLNAILVFSIDKGVCHSLTEFYPQVKFHSTLTPLTLQYASRYPYSTNKPYLYCYINEDKLTTTIIKDGQLMFMNTYLIHQPTDVIYFIACVAQRHNITLSQGNIYISGDEPIARNTVKSLAKIGLRGFLIKDAEELSHHPLTTITQFPYDLKVLLLKAF